MKKFIFTVCMLSTILLAGCNSNNEIKDVKNPNSGEVISSGEDVSKDIKNLEYLNLHETRLYDLLANKDIDMHLIAPDETINIGKIKLDDKDYILQIKDLELFITDTSGKSVTPLYTHYDDACELSTFNDKYLMIAYIAHSDPNEGYFEIYDKNLEEQLSNHVHFDEGKNSFTYELSDNKILFSAYEPTINESGEYEESNGFTVLHRIDFEISEENGALRLNFVDEFPDDIIYSSAVQ